MRRVALPLLALATLSCGDSRKVVVPPSSPASEAECAAFYERFEAACSSGRSEAAADLFDWDHFVAIVLEGRVTRRFADDFKRGLLRSIENPSNFVYQMARLHETGNTSKLLRVREIDGQSRVLVRANGEQGINYYDFVVGKTPAGEVRAFDAYMFLSGELISHSVRRVVLPMLKSSGSIVGRLLGKENLWLEHAEDIKRLGVAAGSGDTEQTLAIYRSLPKELQEHKNLLILRLTAVGMSDEEEYVAAMQAFRELYPGDACIDMISIDWFFLRQQYDEALACIRRVDESVGGDPALWALAAGIMVVKEDFAAARRELDRAKAAEPDLVDIYTKELELGLAQRDHAGARAALERLVTEFGYEFGDLQGEEVFADFVASPEHARWVEFVEKRK